MLSQGLRNIPLYRWHEGQGMRVVIEQHHSLRRELAILGLIVVFGIVTVVLLLLPGIVG